MVSSFFTEKKKYTIFCGAQWKNNKNQLPITRQLILYIYSSKENVLSIVLARSLFWLILICAYIFMVVPISL